jgi:poly(3-hydroxybutyrate) depolymerase
MNIDRHVNAHLDFFDQLVTGDGDSAAKHREFYNEYRSVMDLTAEFFLQTIDTVFVKHALPKGEMKHRAMPVDLSAIRRVGLLTVKVKTTTFRGSAKPLPRKTSRRCPA